MSLVSKINDYEHKIRITKVKMMERKEIDTEREKLESLEKEYTELIVSLEETYGIIDYDTELDWEEGRDGNYIEEMCWAQSRLVELLETVSAGDEKDQHRVKKDMEALIHTARQIKKEKNSDIEKAQRVVQAMDDIIVLCDKHRDSGKK